MSSERESPTWTVDLRDFPPIMLAVPSVAWTWTEAANAIDNLRRYLPPGSLTFRPQGFSEIATMRNNIAQFFLENAKSRGFEYLLWIDGDMTPRPETAVRLLSVAMAHDTDLLSATCFGRIPPFPLIMTGLPGQEFDAVHGIREVLATGFGCVLEHRRVLEHCPSPWFATRGIHGQPGSMGEDYYHCELARRHGFRVFLDGDLDCGHLAVVPITREFATAWQSSETGRAQLEECGRPALELAGQ